MNVEHQIKEYIDALSRFRERLFFDEVFDETIFSEIKVLNIEICKAMKPKHDIPKILLASITETVNLAQNQHPHLKAGADNISETVNEIWKTFMLIVASETHEDRMSGRPRVI